MQHALVAPAQNRQRAVAGHGADGFAVVEIVFEFFAFFFFARDNLRVDFRFVPQFFAQAANQRGVFGKLLHQNRARAIERGFSIGHVFADKRRGSGFHVLRLFGKQQIRQRLQTVLARDLRFGAAFGFVGQVQVFQRGFVVGGFDLALQFGREFALLGYRFEHGGAALFQFAQIL